jgi:uncharacterized repeat protein (TIGR03803 family)
MDPSGNLYGTTPYGGTTGNGTVFELSPSGGGWTEQVIYNFGSTCADGNIVPGLTMDAAGNIFGATCTTVFELSQNGNGGWNPTVLHTNKGLGYRGLEVFGAPVLDKAGNLYFTSANAGHKGHGAVHKLSLDKKGKWLEKILYSFVGGTADGDTPWGGVVLDAVGNIYGTTAYGGVSGNDGTVFELVAPVGKGSYGEKVFWRFSGPDGLSPYDSLILDSAGNLYGTTIAGGSTYGQTVGAGVVFKVTP